MSVITEKLPPKPIKGAGLTVPGVVILQSLTIFIFEALDILINKQIGITPAAAIITGLGLLLAYFIGFYLGRPGTSLATAVNPPIAFFLSTIIVLPLVGHTGLHISLFGTALIKSLAKMAPYLLIGSLFSWGVHFTSKRN
jgi:hypothetical protein